MKLVQNTSFASGLDGNLGMVAFLNAGVTEEDVQQLQNKLNLVTLYNLPLLTHL